MKEDIQVKIPLALYKAVEDIVLQTENIKNPSDVVSYVLKEYVPGYKDNVYSGEEEKEIKKRLKDLGYIG